MRRFMPFTAFTLSLLLTAATAHAQKPPVIPPPVTPAFPSTETTTTAAALLQAYNEAYTAWQAGSTDNPKANAYQAQLYFKSASDYAKLADQSYQLYVQDVNNNILPPFPIQDPNLTSAIQFSYLAAYYGYHGSRFAFLTTIGSPNQTRINYSTNALQQGQIGARGAFSFFQKNNITFIIP